MLGDDSNERARRRDDLDEVIVAALAAGRSYAEAAQLSGTSARTVRRRMSDVGFAAEVSARRGERVGVNGSSSGVLGPIGLALVAERQKGLRHVDRLSRKNSHVRPVLGAASPPKR